MVYFWIGIQIVISIIVAIDYSCRVPNITSVTNVVKHSKATICKIQIIQEPTELSIIVEDNGVGV